MLKRRLLAGAALCPFVLSIAVSDLAQAQVVTRQTLSKYNNANIFPNSQGLVTPSIVNSMFNQTFNGMGVLGDANAWTGVNTFSNQFFGNGTVPGGFSFGCGYSGSFGSYSGNPSCLSVTASPLAGVLGAPTNLILKLNFTAPSANGSQGFYNTLGTLSVATSGDGGNFTALTSSYTTGATVLSVASTTGMSPGSSTTLPDFPRIVLDNGELFSTVITAVGSGTVTISPGLPSAASSGNAFYNAKGTFDGGIIQAQGGTGGVNLNAVIGATATAYMSPGSSTAIRADLSVERDVPNTVAATLMDAEIHIGGQSGITAFAKYGIAISDFYGVLPLSSTSTVLFIGGLYQTAYNVATVIDASNHLNVTDTFAKWSHNGTIYSISANGNAFLGAPEFAQNFLSLQLYDTLSTCNGGGLQRIVGNGSGSFVWQVSTDSTCQWGTGTSVWRVLPNATFEIDAGFQISNTLAWDTNTANCGGGAATRCLIVINPNNNPMESPYYGVF